MECVLKLTNDLQPTPHIGVKLFGDRLLVVSLQLIENNEMKGTLTDMY